MLTHINTYVIIPNKSTAISVKKRFCAVLFPAKIYRPATHPIHFAADSPDKILRLYCVGGIFFLGKPYLENFMSRPSVIPAFRPTPLQNRGRNFVRSKRRSTYTSSGTLYLFLRLNNSETTFGNAFWAQRWRARTVPWTQIFNSWKFCVPPGLHFCNARAFPKCFLLGRACPKPCRVTIKFIIVPWTEYNTSFDDTLLLFLQKSNYLRWPVVRCNYFMSFHQSLDLVWKNTEHMIQ